jgi:Uma2 family endonuclease
LSLDISKYDLSNYGIKDEIKPDVCLYPSSIDLQEFDVVKMTDMPLLAIEILSPSQGIPELKRKIHAFFELGVKSCWLVIPDVKTIYVYSQPTEYRVFAMDDTEVVDEVMDIHLSIAKVFRRREVSSTTD